MLLGKLDACPETLPADQIPALDGGTSACELGDDEGSFNECIGTCVCVRACERVLIQVCARAHYDCAVYRATLAHGK